MAVDESLITRCAGKDASVYRKIKIRDMRTEVCGAVHTSCSSARFGAAFSIIRPCFNTKPFLSRPFSKIVLWFGMTKAIRLRW